VSHIAHYRYNRTSLSETGEPDWLTDGPGGGGGGVMGGKLLFVTADKINASDGAA